MHERNECKVPTVKVKSDTAPDGYVVMNESDFDPSVHVKHEDAPPAPPAA